MLDSIGGFVYSGNMANSIKVTKDCRVRIPGLARKQFAAGDIVQPDSPYFLVLRHMGLANDSGVPAQPGTPATYPHTITIQEQVLDGDIAIYNASTGLWVPTQLSLEVSKLLNSNYADVVDTQALVRIEREALSRIRRYNSLSRAAIADAVPFTEAWANTTAWSGSGTVASGRVYSSGGLQRTAPTSRKWVARTTLHVPGTNSGKYSYFGVVLADGSNFGIGQGSASSMMAVLRSGNIAAGDIVIPRQLPNFSAAGDWLCTISKDDTHLSVTMQPAGTTGQNVYGARIALAKLSSSISTIFVSANDATAGGQNFGPVVINQAFAVPPASARTVGGVALFGAGKPLVHLFADKTSGFGRVMSVPGDLDARVAAPIVFHAHQSLTGVAFSPWTESRWANVLTAFESNGYVLVTSDGGPGYSGGGQQDKFGNQTAIDDAASAIDAARKNVNSSATFLLGTSMGNYLNLNLLAQRKVGGIHALANISGGSDLDPFVTDPTYSPLVLAAYGASDAADFETKSKGYNPIDDYASAFRGIPQRWYQGSTDTTNITAAQVTPFVNKVLPFVPEFEVVGGAVGHLDASLYQGNDLVAFFDRYR